MFQMCLRVLSVLLIVGASIPALSQVVPQAQRGRGNLPLRMGVGYSNYGSDWDGRLGGPAVWVDLDLPKLPPSWSGFQLEFEGRDLNYNRTGADPKLRQYTLAGGINYAWRYDPAFHPYVKFLAGIGNVDFSVLSPNFPNYTKDSRTFYAPAGGVEVRVHDRIWVRGNYEYQFWPDFFRYHTLTPHGFTVGVFYDFSKFALGQYHP
jgi:opacity protein-like surface antigen